MTGSTPKRRGRPRGTSRTAPKRKLTSRQARAAELLLKKVPENPILKPRPEHAWESWQTFNPAALVASGKVHLLYRAIGEHGLSVLGYATSKDGVVIDERSDKPVFVAPKPVAIVKLTPYSALPYTSGGSWAGCEDPRITAVDDRVYMLYTAFDGWNLPRIALTSIKLRDFLSQKWQWSRPFLLSPPGEIHKNWVLFPEKIKGKFAILHSVSPEILVDYFDNLDDFKDDEYIKSHYHKTNRKEGWDTWVRGAGPPPIKTSYGWLLLYHAMDANDPNRYKLGAMILDLKDPTKVLYRASKPILEPDEFYENWGHKAGVVFSCGAVVIDGKLFIYYGGADTVVCAAVAELEDFLQALMKTGKPKLHRVKK